MQKVTIEDIGGELIKDTDVYTLKDNRLLTQMVLSSTLLRAGKNTTGHRHVGQEEVYYFIDGEGTMEVDHRVFPINAGDVVLIQDGEFHKVYNTGHLGLNFICVFNGKRSH